MALVNPNPIVYKRKKPLHRREVSVSDETAREDIDSVEVFEHLKDIKDPEHPYSLEQLNVIREEDIYVDDSHSSVRIVFTPTVEHCNMATLIGLCIRVKLIDVLPKRFKVDIELASESHISESAINKQLNDKERIAAALENPSLVEMVHTCLQATEPLLAD